VLRVFAGLLRSLSGPIHSGQNDGLGDKCEAGQNRRD